MFIYLKVHKKEIYDTNNIRFKLASESQHRKERKLLLDHDIHDSNDDHSDDLMIHIS